MAGLATFGPVWTAPLGSAAYLQVQVQNAAARPGSYAALMRFKQSANEMTGLRCSIVRYPTWSAPWPKRMSTGNR